MTQSDLRDDFDAFFERAFGHGPFDYQRRLAIENPLPSLLCAPTGAGKTKAVLGAWLWRRTSGAGTVGRRLVYCLPMRTLVEQTLRVARDAIERLGLSDRIAVHALMGGDATDTWDMNPERECILIGTQDMLLSRALNRGYAMSRFRWPVHFGLLNNDCLWVFDEVQLMGNGLATSTQLAAFRERFGAFGPSASIWMSATLTREWLATVDFAARVDGLQELTLAAADRATPVLASRLRAAKSLDAAPTSCRTPEGLAAFVREQHTPGTQSLVVVNKVARAREVHDALRAHYSTEPAKGKKRAGVAPLDPNAPDLLLLHSRFRPAERRGWLEALSAPVEPGSAGRIIAATQVVEAGVDISSRLLVTDIAPFASVVQRFGRCNREGEHTQARVFWVDRPLRSKEAKLADREDLDERSKAAIAAPYAWRDLETASELLAGCRSVAPADLPAHVDAYEPAHVLRRRDLVDLFDTTPDLSGYDLDVSRFVRGGEERDVAVAWRDLGGKPPERDAARLGRDELCPVPIGELTEFLKKRGAAAWMWDAVEGEWRRAPHDLLRPGLEVLLDVSAGGYSRDRGWDPAMTAPVDPVAPGTDEANESVGDDPETYRRYLQTLEAHSREAREKAKAIVAKLALPDLAEFEEQLFKATQHHDWGKVHRVFQETLHGALAPDDPARNAVLAKSIGGGRHARPRFRHELASALALLERGASDLCVYLAACHHGKVRLSIRALPGEPGEKAPPPPGAKFARGVYDGDVLDAVDLGDGEIGPVTLDLEPMLLGADADVRPSWLSRMIALRDSVGVFRLAYLESLIRAADVQASSDPVNVLPDSREVGR